MINYNKNKLINTCLETYYATFAQTLDTADFVPEKYNKKILAYIVKNMKDRPRGQAVSTGGAQKRKIKGKTKCQRRAIVFL